MAPRKPVPSLFSSSGQAVARAFKSFSEEFLKKTSIISHDLFTDSIEILKLHLHGIIAKKNAEITQLWLNLAKELELQYKSPFYKFPQFRQSWMTKVEFAVNGLVSLIVHLNPESLILEGESSLVTCSLFDHLCKLKNLKNLKCHGLRSDEMNEKLLSSLPVLTKLTHLRVSFAHPDFIAKVSDICENLECLDLYGSYVTNNTIECVTRLKKVRTIDLQSTKVTGKGFVELLMLSQSETLSHIKMDKFKFKTFRNCLVKGVKPFRTFNLRCLSFENVDSDWLRIISKYFPLLNSLKLDCELANIPDLSSLSALKCCNVVKLHVTHTSDDNLDKLFSLQCSVVMNLTVFIYRPDKDVKIDLNKFLKLGLRCPNLNSVWFSICSGSCSFFNNFGTTSLYEKPFQKLKDFYFSRLSSLHGLETILSYAENIESIHFTTSKETVGSADELLVSIFQLNSLSKLESLYFLQQEGSCILSDEMLKYAITHCPMLSTLGIGEMKKVSPGKFAKLQNFIVQNNYEVAL